MKHIKFEVITANGKVIAWFTNAEKLRRFIRRNDPSLIVKYLGTGVPQQ